MIDPQPESFWRALTGHTTEWKVAQFCQAQAENFRFLLLPVHPNPIEGATQKNSKLQPAKPRLTAVPIDVLPLQIALLLLKPLQQRHKERDDEVQRDGQLLGSAAGGFSPILRPFGDARVSRNVDTQPSRQGRAVMMTLNIQDSWTPGLTQRCRSLYRRSLKLALDWAVQRSLWRGQAVYIRTLFDANKTITDPRHQRVW